MMTVSGVIPMVPGTFAFSTMLGILQVTGIIDIGSTDSIDLILFNQVVPDALTTGFVLAALGMGIAAPTLLFRRKPVV